jgi:hypothetical protein
MRHILTILGLIFLWSNLFAGNVYFDSEYVDTGGDGSKLTPYKYLPQQRGGWEDADTCWILYRETAYDLYAYDSDQSLGLSGTTIDDIVFIGYGGGRPVILEPQSGTYPIQNSLNYKFYNLIIVFNFTFINYLSSGATEFSNCDFSNYLGSVLLVRGDWDAVFNNCNFTSRSTTYSGHTRMLGSGTTGQELDGYYMFNHCTFHKILNVMYFSPEKPGEYGVVLRDCILDSMTALHYSNDPSGTTWLLDNCFLDTTLFDFQTATSGTELRNCVEYTDGSPYEPHIIYNTSTYFTTIPDSSSVWGAGSDGVQVGTYGYTTSGLQVGGRR